MRRRAVVAAAAIGGVDNGSTKGAEVGDERTRNRRLQWVRSPQREERRFTRVNEAARGVSPAGSRVIVKATTTRRSFHGIQAAD